MEKIRIAINGFGRIGRLCLRKIVQDDSFEIVAINDLTDAKQLAHLLKYDTSHRNFLVNEITSDENHILIKDKAIKIYSETNPENLPWKELNIDLVIESTGLFTSYDKAKAHITAGAKKVIISAPATGDLKTIVYNVNDNILDGSEEIISAASCTTNCLAPVLKILDDNFKVEKGFMTTVHAVTNDQTTLDIAHNKGIDARRGRAASFNIIPSSTGAAKAVGLVLPNLQGKLDGSSLRVPTSTGSVVDLTVELKTNTSIEQINKAMEDNSNETIHYTTDPIVSSDVIGSEYGSVVDGQLTSILEVDGKQLVKIVSWYDNETGYTVQMLRTAKKLFNITK